MSNERSPRNVDAGRVAFVTGGASGIGQACCLGLAAQGMVVAIADIAQDAARRLAQSLGDHRSIGVLCNVAERASVDDAIARVADELGKIDVLVNCAGIIGPQLSREIQEDAWDSVISVHLGGVMRSCRAAYPFLKATGAGSIVSISSIAAHVGIPTRLSYSAAKAGIEALTRTLAVEWAADGIRTNAVAPGYIRTPLTQQAVDAGQLDIDAVRAGIPLGRFGEPAELAAAVVFLSSLQASFVTGQTLVVDGGQIVNGA